MRRVVQSAFTGPTVFFREGVQMVHIAAYVDESYFDDDSVFMGGYVASVEAWSALIPRWKDILDEHPRVLYFHNSGFKSEKWCHDQGVADTHLLPAKLIKLASLIAASGLSFPALSIMEKSLFDEIIKPRIKAEKNPQYELLRNVYYFSYARLLALLFHRIQELNDIRKRPGITLCVNRPNEPLRKLPYPLAAVQLCGRS
jgi:hypothetical protein